MCAICGSASRGEPRHELRLLAGYSPFSTTLIGTATNRQFGLAEVSYSQQCWSWTSVSLSYTAAIVPVAVLRQPQQIEAVVSNQGILTVRSVPAHGVYGFAVLPVGFFAQFARHRRVHPVAELNGGIIASTEPIPEPGINATGLNFVFDIGGGVRWDVGSRSAATAGYRFLHISNANTTGFNPGLDNNVFYASYSFLW